MSALSYATLAQTHPDYNAARIKELDDLYVGGWQILDAARTYIKPLQGEHPARYAERVNGTAFIGYMAQIVDSISGGTFSDPLTVTPDAGSDSYWSDFLANADLQGTPIDMVCRKALTRALLHGRAVVACDFPATSNEAASRAEEDAFGASRAYVLDVEPCELIDWEYSSRITRSVGAGAQRVDIQFGELSFAVIRKRETRRTSAAASRGTVVETFKVWRIDDAGLVVWDLYAISYEASKPPRANDPVPLVSSGVTSFKSIPLVELVLPAGLWIGNKIGPMNLEHWSRRGLLNASENRGLLSVPVCKLGPEVTEAHSSLPSEVQSDPGRGYTLVQQLNDRGYICIGAGDDLYFAEPDGKAQAGAASRIKDLVDEMFRVTHLMASSVSSTANGVARSGASKAEDRHATVIVLKTLGAIVKDFADRMLKVIAKARGEMPQWSISGCTSFDIYDRAEVVAEAQSLAAVEIESETFRKTYQKQLAARLLPDIGEATQQAIAEEIDASEEDDAEEDAAESPRDTMPAPPMPEDEADAEDVDQED